MTEAPEIDERIQKREVEVRRRLKKKSTAVEANAMMCLFLSEQPVHASLLEETGKEELDVIEVSLPYLNTEGPRRHFMKAPAAQMTAKLRKQRAEMNTKKLTNPEAEELLRIGHSPRGLGRHPTRS